MGCPWHAVPHHIRTPTADEAFLAQESVFLFYFKQTESQGLPTEAMVAKEAT